MCVYIIKFYELISFFLPSKDWWSNFSAALIATFLGVLIAFCFERRKKVKEERQIFQAGLKSLLYETSNNLTVINKLNKNIGPKSTILSRLSIHAEEFILKDPIVHKLGGQGLMEFTSQMLHYTKNCNNVLDFVQKRSELKGEIDKEDLDLIKNHSKMLEFTITKVQELLDWYFNFYKVKNPMRELIYLKIFNEFKKFNNPHNS